MRRTRASTWTVAAAAGGLLVGLFSTALWSDETPRWRVTTVAEVEPLTRLTPMRALPRTELVVLALRARDHLDEGRPWQAWSLLRERVEEDGTDAPPSTVLLAARAAGEWGGWDHARALLRGAPWLDQAGGEGWLWLARAEEAGENWERAAEAYRRYAERAEGAERGLAYARLGRVLRETGDPAGAADAFSRAAPLLPEVEDWLRTLHVEQLVEADDPAAADAALQATGGSTPARLARVRGEARAWAQRGDTARALRRLGWEARVLSAQGAHGESAALQVERARLLHAAGRTREAREALRAVAMQTTVPGAVRGEAAALLGELDGRSAGDELARAAGYAAADRPGLAARSLRAALEAGAPDDAGVRLRLARLLWEERDYGPAHRAFEQAADRISDPELAAEARLFAARALYRASGRRGERQAVQHFRDLAERYPGTAAAGTALFLLGDEAPSLRDALGYYRRAAEVPHSPDAREALFRVGDRRLRLDDARGAIRAWEEYVRRYPEGEETAEIAYRVARLHARADRDRDARAMYEAAIQADPLSYHALRAGEQLGASPLDRVLAAPPRAWPGLAADPLDARAVLHRLDRLEQAGLDQAWKQELDAALRSFRERPAARVVLAEGLRDRGHPVTAMRLGRELAEQRGWDERLLRLVFPFPYRELVEREADRADVDPFLLAGLIRQESTWRPAVKSWVGATGLGQIMPATGRWLASSIGVRPYEPQLLEVPEVNLRMAAVYLGDLLERYDGAEDLALASYNAGPGRGDRWRRTIYRRDTDAFRDAIPFDETRHYVKVVLRNRAVYQRLYGE